MRQPKYFFGGEAFTSKEAVKKRASKIICRYFGMPEIPEGTDDYRFVEELLLNHIDAESKIELGIQALYVDHAPDHPTKCFWIRRIQGKPTDFGIPSCLDSPYSLNRASLRDLVRDQIDNFKARRLKDCTGVFISDFSGHSFPTMDAVVDHAPPFDVVVRDFFRPRSEDPRKELLTRSVDACSVPIWKDAKLAEAFRHVHGSAGLRLVDKKENLSSIKRIHNETMNSTRREPLK